MLCAMGCTELPPTRDRITRLADMAGGNNVCESTVRRWRDELITLLAVQHHAWTAP
jgi:predicted secreted protein